MYVQTSLTILYHVNLLHGLSTLPTYTCSQICNVSTNKNHNTIKEGRRLIVYYKKKTLMRITLNDEHNEV